jgi:ATP-binding cassette subfamily B protein RaxB
MSRLGVPFRRRSVKLVRQSEVAECGLACMAMIATYHGFDVDLNSLRRRYDPSTRGASFKTLMRIGDDLGLIARAVQVPLGSLKAIAVPAVLHWDMNHFVVLETFKGSNALIHDPKGRSGWLTPEDVSSHFTGVALQFRPSTKFQTGRVRERLRLSELWQAARGLKRAIAQATILSLALQVLTLAGPYYMQLAVDTALPARDYRLLYILMFGFSVIVILNSTVSLLRSSIILTSGSALGSGITSNLAHHLFRLPEKWFFRRQVGDVLSRFQSISPIRNLLTEDLASVPMDAVLALTTLMLMIFYSLTLTSITIAAVSAAGLVRLLTYPVQWGAQEEAIVAEGKEQTFLIETIRGIRTVRLFGQEALRHAIWQAKMFDAVNAKIQLERVGIWQKISNASISGIENIIIVGVAIGYIMDGQFTVGMLFAYLAYKIQFVQAANSMQDKLLAFRMITLHLERLGDITSAPEDLTLSATGAQENLFEGGIELKVLTYRYSPEDPLVLDGVNLVVAPGEIVAITGPSGSGKSTLVRLLLGLEDPTSGEILADGVHLADFGYQSFRRQVAAVLQDDGLFSGTIAENITMFGERAELDDVRAAATAAAVAEDIEQMPMRYETLVGDMGSALSGGQRQRILIARALYRKPKLLIMDEGTSHLDGLKEREVSRAISALGITRIIIAHRRETLETADRVFVLSNGQLVPAEGNAKLGHLAVN